VLDAEQFSDLGFHLRSLEIGMNDEELLLLAGLLFAGRCSFLCWLSGRLFDCFAGRHGYRMGCSRFGRVAQHRL